MKTWQWIVLMLAFDFLAVLLASISMQWQSYCFHSDLTGFDLVSCIRSQIFAPFPYIFFTLSLVCFFALPGIIDWFNKLKEKQQQMKVTKE